MLVGITDQRDTVLERQRIRRMQAIRAVMIAGDGHHRPLPPSANRSKAS